MCSIPAHKVNKRYWINNGQGMFEENIETIKGGEPINPIFAVFPPYPEDNTAEEKNSSGCSLHFVSIISMLILSVTETNKCNREW
jgi:hypothetical protein